MSASGHMIYKSKWVYGITVVALSIGLLSLFTGCPDNGVGAIGEDGTITIRVTGAGDHSGKPFLGGVVVVGTDKCTFYNRSKAGYVADLVDLGRSSRLGHASTACAIEIQ